MIQLIVFIYIIFCSIGFSPEVIFCSRVIGACPVQMLPVPGSRVNFWKTNIRVTSSTRSISGFDTASTASIPSNSGLYTFGYFQHYFGVRYCGYSLYLEYVGVRYS